MAKQSLAQICEEIYAKFGQFAVEDYVLENYPEQEWGWCIPCENEEPMEQGWCLICGTHVDEEDE